MNSAETHLSGKTFFRTHATCSTPPEHSATAGKSRIRRLLPFFLLTAALLMLLPDMLSAQDVVFERKRGIYPPFVWPFMAGMTFALLYLLTALVLIIGRLGKPERRQLGRSLLSVKIFQSIRDIFSDCLVHTKIFRHNKLLGYMHMSIALGWFLLIVVGHIEVFLYTPHRGGLLYYPIFFRYFVSVQEHSLQGSLLFFIMDFLLLFVLSGVILAMIKRLRSRWLGMRRTTRLRLGDIIALYSLWAIFPLRLIAESFTSGVSGGSFLTLGFGSIFDGLISNPDRLLPFWWAYSIALGTFMVSLPFSRYMHIPTEILLILMRNAGIRSKSPRYGVARVEIYSCSRCGLCLDACQMGRSGKHQKDATVYFMRKLRYREPGLIDTANACMMCNRCNEACPVEIDSCRLKQHVRAGQPYQITENYSQLPAIEAPRADVLYYGGCMTQLTPLISRSLLTVLRQAGINVQQLDADGGFCCGRPLMLAGRTDAATELIERNTAQILASGAKTLLTSCPICYKIFRENYRLPIETVHHSAYLYRLLEEGRLNLRAGAEEWIYHDPCELGRGSGIYRQPRSLLNKLGTLQRIPEEKSEALCCGGSLGTLSLSRQKKLSITKDALATLTQHNPKKIITACPLCQKTFAQATSIPVVDIAQAVLAAQEPPEHPHENSRKLHEPEYKQQHSQL
ncbi:MAG: 4Fe-4S dicluster domain-containing protein [Bacteroidales bacterium]|jgi:Fe-S oxidoreductase|nr:4Fe-4S dicluster domain-containing protein [Bacteroidales bacterium]